MLNMAEKKDKPLVTVAIPAYNASSYIREAVESVLMQDYDNYELVIVDDCSTDNTYGLLQQIEDPRVRLFKNKKNLGAEANWNRCLDLATGKYFLLLPGDDLLYQGSIRRRVEVLEADKQNELAFCFCARRIINSKSEKIMDVSFCKEGLIKREKLLKKNVIAGMNVIGEPAAGLFRKGLVQKVGYYNQRLPYVIDLDYWVRLLEFGDAYYIDKPLCAFRVTSVNWTSRLGARRYTDYKQIISVIKSLPYSKVSPLVSRYGVFRCWVNEYMRRVFYLFFRR